MSCAVTIANTVYFFAGEGINTILFVGEWDEYTTFLFVGD